MNITWEGLVRNDQKINLQAQGMIEPVHCGSNSILKVRFFGHPVYVCFSSVFSKVHVFCFGQLHWLHLKLRSYYWAFVQGADNG